MSSASDVQPVIDSIRSNGTDTVPPKTTGFLNLDKVAPTEEQNDSDAPAGYYSSNLQVGSARDLHGKGHRLWTNQHEEQELARRERRENRERGHFIADVPDFDHKAHKEAWQKEKSAQEKSSCCMM